MGEGARMCLLAGWLPAATLLIGAGAVPANAQGRIVVSLDGAWQFRLDPEGSGKDARWYSAEVPFKDTIQVPGAWQAQGFGTESDKLHHSYEGQAWYRRDVAIPSDWAGRRVFLCIGGVHRYAEVWVNGTRLGEHIGYLSPFESEITQQTPAGKTATIAVCVDCKQRWDIDCLTGCFDIIDEMFTVWGGIWGHVSIESRGPVWAEDLFVQTRAAPPSCTATARLVGDETAADSVVLQILAKGGRVAASSPLALDRAVGPGGELKIVVQIPDAQLWSPKTPHLYTARLSLLKGRTTVDQTETRFGVREIQIRGGDLYLNGKKIFLHGYGDDSVYPQTMAAPSDKDFYLKRLKVAKDYGFNYVRHHSTILPPDYYDATDEAGVFVSAEFPIAYMQYYMKAKGPALELYKSEWAAAIKRLRNHPSIFDWCMGNELCDSIPIAPDMYKIAKSLDPGRPVIDSDGLRVPPFVRGPSDRDTLDFFQSQFDEWSLALDVPVKYAFEQTPRKPVLSHETGNYATFPRLSQIDEFRDNFKPFWLVPARAKLEKLGLLGEAEQWSKNSERLYYLAHKLNMEAIRKNPRMSGYTWWLIQDYWTGSNGIVDAYFHVKDIPSPAVRQFNADVVLLENGLALTYRAGERLRTRLSVSNYAQEAIKDGILRWEVKLGDRVFAAKDLIAAQAAQGEVRELVEVQANLPDVSEPQRVTVVAELKVGPEQYRNDWHVWLYPAKSERPRLQVSLFAGHDLLGLLSVFGAKPLPDARPTSGPAVYVVTQPSQTLVDAVAAGSCVLCISPQGVFSTVRNRFKPAWWIGNDVDCNTGTVVYDNPVTRAVAPEGWCDAGWYRLLEGADAYVLDDFHAQPHVLVRGLDVHFRCRSKSLLFEVKVGKGSLIVCGLNVVAGCEAQSPEAQWLLSRLVEYAGTLPKPNAELPVAFLRKQVAKAPAPEGPIVSGFARLIRNDGETMTNASYRDAQAPIYVCRQTEPGHAIEWQTAPVPDGLTAKTVTFAFAGALGWRSQPASDGFSLLLNGKELLTFNFAQAYHSWPSPDGKAVLYFAPKKGTSEDALGLFYLTLPADQLAPGGACRLAVRSKGRGSGRWFGLSPYTDTAAPPGMKSFP